MISNQVIKTCIDELRAITKVELCVMDMDGQVIAKTEDIALPDKTYISEFSSSFADSQIIGPHHLLKVIDEGEPIFILDACGSGDDTYMIAKIAVSELNHLVVAYKEKFDRNNFFQNLLLDNMLLVDIYNRAKKLHIEVNAHRAVYLIETGWGKNTEAGELLQGMFSNHSGDFITAVDEGNVILIKQLSPDDDIKEQERIANTIVDMMSMEAMLNVRVSFGTVVEEIKEVSKSYKEAKVAMEVGKIFYAERKVSAYNTLGIGRLIYQLPINLCRIFIDEIFGEGMPDELDEETLHTVNVFLENNLNVSETSRQLFIHRNTLMYRIEKLEKSTGLDIRVFDDAMTFKIAMMVFSYMKYLDALETEYQ